MSDGETLMLLFRLSRDLFVGAVGGGRRFWFMLALLDIDLRYVV